MNFSKVLYAESMLSDDLRFSARQFLAGAERGPLLSADYMITSLSRRYGADSFRLHNNGSTAYGVVMPFDDYTRFSFPPRELAEQFPLFARLRPKQNSPAVVSLSFHGLSNGLS